MRARTLRCLSVRPQLHELESRTVPTLYNLSTLSTHGATLSGYENLAESGQSVAGAGDVNGDGYDDMIVGTPFANGGRGAAHIIFGGPGWPGASMALNNHGPGGLTVRGFESGMAAGSSVAGAGDVNGDGYDDVIVGASDARMGGARRGAAYIVYGRASYGGTALSLDNLDTLGTTLRGFEDEARAGWCVSGAGDLNDDGFADVIVGSPFRDAGGTDRGEAYVIYGTNLLPGFSLSLGSLGSWGSTLRGFENESWAGLSVSGAGDINNDNYDDVIVGAPMSDAGGTNSGAAYIVLGGGIARNTIYRLNTLGSRCVTLNGFENWGTAGRGVAGVGDYDGDGFADVLVGAPAATAGQGNDRPGEAYLVCGAAILGGKTVTFNNMPRGVTFVGADASASTGKSVAGAGDFNDDGYADVIIGAPNARAGVSSGRGEAYVVRGRQSLVSTYTVYLSNLGSNDCTLRGFENNMAAGFAVGGAGDVNGDGYDDVLVGALQTNSGGTDRGAAYLFLGQRSLFFPPPMGLSTVTNTSPHRTEGFRGPSLPPPPDSSDPLVFGGVDVDSDPGSLDHGPLTARSGVRPNESLFPDDGLFIDS